MYNFALLVSIAFRFLEDARTASHLLGIALARAHGYKTKGQELPMAGVPFWAFDR